MAVTVRTELRHEIVLDDVTEVTVPPGSNLEDIHRALGGLSVYRTLVDFSIGAEGDLLLLFSVPENAA